MKIVIVGCTHAGTAAAAQILKDHPEATVTIYERDDNISFLSCGIYLYLGGKGQSLGRYVLFVTRNVSQVGGNGQNQT